MRFPLWYAGTPGARLRAALRTWLDINGACPQEELDPTMAKKSTKKAKKGKR